MGGFAGCQVKTAAIYVMEILMEKKSFQYGKEIYDGTAEKSKELEKLLMAMKGKRST